VVVVVVDDPHARYADNNRARLGGAGDRRNADDGCRAAAAACPPARFEKQCAAEWFMYGRMSAGLGSIRCRDCRMVTRIATAADTPKVTYPQNYNVIIILLNITIHIFKQCYHNNNNNDSRNKFVQMIQSRTQVKSPEGASQEFF